MKLGLTLKTYVLTFLVSANNSLKHALWIFFSALNDGCGLLDLSEENLEKMHKVARRLREKKCRLTGPKDNLTDLLNRFVTLCY